MPRTQQKTTPWSDWHPLLHPDVNWFGSAKAGLPAGSVPGPFVNIAGCQFKVDQMDARAGALFQQGAAPKPTIVRPSGATVNDADIGFFRTIKIPDHIIAKQAGRLADWTGSRGTGSGSKMGDGGRRIAIQIENVFYSRGLVGATDTIGADLVGFSLSVKTRGFGAPTTFSTPSGGTVSQTQDTAIAANYFGNPNVTIDLTANPPVLGVGSGISIGGQANTTAFPDLSLPSDATTDLGAGNQNIAPSFGAGRTDLDGVCRIQTIVEMPNTLLPGSVLDIICGIRVPVTGAGAAGIDVQWAYSSYRWIKGGPDASYPFLANTSHQLSGAGDDEDAQPYTDTPSSTDPQGNENP